MSSTAVPLAPLSPLEGEMSPSGDRGGYGAPRSARRLRHVRVTPLCPLRGHLPLKGGEGAKSGCLAERQTCVLRKTQSAGVNRMPHHDVPSHLRRQARRFRRDLTTAERRFWYAVRAHRLDGIAFRRQMPIGGYIADFAVPEYRLIVEIDGEQHGLAAGLVRDERRDNTLECLGWITLRFWNHDVLTNLDGVLQTILSHCRSETRP